MFTSNYHDLTQRAIFEIEHLIYPILEYSTTAMASLQGAVDAVKIATASVATCTPATVVSLKDLLQLAEPEASTTTTSRSKATTTTKKTPARAGKEQLSSRDRMLLATHVVNVTIKALSEACKTNPQPKVKSSAASEDEARKPALRRSSSAPLSPVQPRSLNRVTATPAKTNNSKAAAPASTSTTCLATVECARLAFACLRSVKGPLVADQTDFQIENGMSALVGKMLALGMHEQALKELRILRKRFDITQAKATTTREAPAATSMADLMEFPMPATMQSLPTITGCQLQLLKLVAATKKASHIESLLRVLDESNASSPVNLLKTLAKSSKDAAKTVRQIAALSQTILSLAPSVATSEDAVAAEPRLSVSPASAFQLQCLAFRCQLTWWKMAGHKGKVDEELVSPLSRCLRAFGRRLTGDEAALYKAMTDGYERLAEMIDSSGYKPDMTPTSATMTIYQALGSAAHAAKRYDDASEWLLKIKDQHDSTAAAGSVRYASVLARLLASTLKQTTLPSNASELAASVIEGLDGSLSGTAADLNDLIDSLSLARRSVVGRLMAILDPQTTKTQTPTELDNLLKSFVLRYPRFVRRWLGAAPPKDAAPKQALQFDQRRQLVMKSINQTLDASLMVLKCDIQASQAEWQQVDEVLQHCSGLLNTLDDPSLSLPRAEQLGGYYVKISSLYFMLFSQLRKEPDRPKETNKQMLQSLSRSIEIVKDRAPAEREKAQLATKLEIFSDMCKGAGRSDDAVRTLRSICTDMAEDGVMKDVAAALASQSADTAWTMTTKASTLSRTLRSLSKLDKSWHDWTFFLPETERAAVLEHLLRLSAAGGASPTPLKLSDPSVTALLRIYSLEKYPVRRFRVLLHLLSQALGEEDEASELVGLVDQALRQVSGKEKGDDEALQTFIPHLVAYHDCVRGLAVPDSGSSAAESAIAVWEGILSSCASKADLDNAIDNPEGWLCFLQSLAQLSELKGDIQLQLRISKLVVAAAKLMPSDSDVPGDAHVAAHCELIMQYIAIGAFAKAQQMIELTTALVDEYKQVSPRVLASLHLAQAEYYAGIGNSDESMDYLSKVNSVCSQSYTSWAASKTQATLVMSTASLLQSMISLQLGELEDALTQSKNSVRLLSHDWSKLEAAVPSANSSTDTSVADASIDWMQPRESKARTAGPKFWTLASPLLRSLLHMSAVYAHVGMFQETIYYGEAALKIAESTESSLYTAQVNGWLASVYLRAGKLDRASALFGDVNINMPVQVSSAKVRLAHSLGEYHSESGDDAAALEYFRLAELTASSLNMELVAIKEEKPKPVSRARSTKARAAPAVRSVKRAPAKAKAAPQDAAASQDVHQASLLAAIILSQAAACIRQKDWTTALSTLERVKDLPKLMGSAYQEQVITAMSLIGHSMEQIISDPVFSIMQDSTISFPAIAKTADKSSPDVTKSPVKRGRAATGGARKAIKETTPAFTEALLEAQALLVQAHATAMSTSDSSMVRRISALLQNTIILLSATSAAGKSKSVVSSALGAVAVDLGHNITWRREQKALCASGSSARAAASEVTASRRMSVALTSDISNFQKSYVESIPASWSVISVSVSDNQHDLCITKFQAGHSPFILRLPLERANSRDADAEIFNFEHGKAELLEIIKLANESSHSAREYTARGESSAWWAEREALDERLKELLVTVESTWLGGFRGIFSQHQHRPDLLARFQKNFQMMLDSYLPSRNGRKKAAEAAGPVTLDPRILDLFIGLGDATDLDCDFDEALVDLLYFVVDILQFHGERNAYDEIDFDAMLVSTYDALRAYHGALKSSQQREDGAHTILVLDKALHSFPWESMPCMDGLAVSRVPSLACLRQLLTETKPSSAASAAAGHYVSAQRGTYMLNPSSDLKNTQSFFQGAFSSGLSTWTSVINKEPTEEAFEHALASSDVLLYFGHGSGAQYIRGKTIRKLDKCQPVSFLMGCSSASLNEAGDFEPYGPVWNYMMAGCPAVVGTLWDVTDRDIDRFAGRTFEEWGLFEEGTFGSGKDVAARIPVTDGASLPEAVMRARRACKFRYLNAAAVVMYGIPVYIDKQQG